MLEQSVTASRYMDCMLHCGSVEVEIGVWQLRRVESSELVTKTGPCLSTTDQVNGRGNHQRTNMAQGRF